MNILITGANSGLGKYLVTKFISEGHNVFEHNGSKHYDLSNQHDLLKLIEDAKQFKVEVLVNNAAVVCPGVDLGLYTADKIHNMINVNLTAPILLTYHLLPQLKNIININSIVGLEVKPFRTMYSATKWGLRGFAQSLKAENKNINILDVYPTNIKTTPDKQNAMEVDYVIDSIYNSFINKEKTLILDGRK